jgi:phosphotransferase system enzyme I (PtsI)
MAAESTHVKPREISESEVESEMMRFEDALIETRKQIRKLQSDLLKNDSHIGSGVLDAHLMVLDDVTLIEEVVERLKKDRRNVEALVREATEKYAKMLGSVEDEYLRERVADVRDVGKRLIRNLSGDKMPSLDQIEGQYVLVASDLAPSQAAALDAKKVTGLATDLGSPTSHTAVMARALDIPTIVALHDITTKVTNGDQVLLDGNKGILILNPTAKQLRDYGKVTKARESIQQNLTTLKEEPAETQDGHRIVLSSNVEKPEEVDAVIAYGAQGIGLFRSEYLFLSRDEVVSEEEQAEVFEDMAAALAPAPVIIRTLDIGGDKFFSKANVEQEDNPFLGCRSIRLSLKNPDQFRSQLKAILRANTHGNIKLMYPMISSVTEVIQANEILEQAKGELEDEGVNVRRNIEVGVMIEIPSAALTAESLAEHVDFFSLGTNDLVQYTIAVDRANESVSYLYEPAHPGVLKLIDATVRAGHNKDIWVGVCGEMAADPVLAPLLVGMGIDELSVAPTSTPLVKDAVRSVSFSRAQNLAGEALKCKTGAEVRRLCRELTQEVAPEVLELV